MSKSAELYQQDLQQIRHRAAEEKRVLVREAFESGLHLAILSRNADEDRRARELYASVLSVKGDDSRVRFMSVVDVDDIPSGHLGIPFIELFA